MIVRKICQVRACNRVAVHYHKVILVDLATRVNLRFSHLGIPRLWAKDITNADERSYRIAIFQAFGILSPGVENDRDNVTDW